MNRKKIERYFAKNQKRIAKNHEKGKCSCGSKKGLMMMGTTMIICPKCLERYSRDCEEHGLPELIPPPELLKKIINVDDLESE